MATATINPNDTTDKAANFNTETWDVAYGFPHKDGKREDPVVVSPETAEKLKDFEGSSVTVECRFPSTFQGLLDLAATPTVDDNGKPVDQKDVQAELVRIFNAGAKVKVNSRLRARLTKQKESGDLVFDEATDLTNGKLDVTSEITSGSKRIFLTEEQKTWRTLTNLPKDLGINMWRVYLTGIGKEFYIPAE